MNCSRKAIEDSHLVLGPSGHIVGGMGPTDGTQGADFNGVFIVNSDKAGNRARWLSDMWQGRRLFSCQCLSPAPGPALRSVTLDVTVS